MATTALDWGLVVIGIFQLAIVGVRLWARDRRLKRIIERNLPTGTQYADEEADGSVVRVMFGRGPRGDGRDG